MNHAINMKPFPIATSEKRLARRRHREAILAKAIIPIALMLVLAGCGRTSERPPDVKSADVQKWIPEGTPLAAAQQIMEQHGFACAVRAYARQELKSLDASLWDHGIARNGKLELVTSFSKLNCGWAASEDLSKSPVISLTVINGMTTRWMVIFQAGSGPGRVAYQLDK